MKRRIYLILIFTMLIAALLLYAMPVAAQATVIEPHGEVTRCDPLEQGEVWPAGMTIHMRGGN